jgi:flagellar motor switch protein FliG
VVLEGSLATARQPSSPAEAVEPTGSADGTDRPFRFLADADAPSLVAFLEKERPQAIALVLSYLPPPRAAQVLAAFSARLQVEIIRRLVELDASDEESLRVVEHQLLEWMQQQHQHRRLRAAGLTAIAGILAASGSTAQRRILENVEALDLDLAGRLGLAVLPESDRRQAAANQSRIVPFEDLSLLPEELLAGVVQRAEPELVVLAMAGASGRLVSQILSILPRGAARALRKRLDNLGPIRLGDVEAAQHELATLAAQAARSGPEKPPGVLEHRAA